MRIRRCTDEHGRAVVAKRPSQPGDEARLRHEAEILAVARHPGVVQLGALTENGDDGVELTTLAVPGGPLVSHCLLPEEAAGTVAALAGIVADLHEQAIAHGALRPEHVLLGDGGRPILCGFGRSHYPATAHDKANDVVDLAHLLLDLATPEEPEADILQSLRSRPTRARWRRWRPEPRAGGHHVLGTIAEWAAAAHPDDRPTARELADALQRQVRGARLPGGVPSTGAARDEPVASAEPGDRRRGQLRRAAWPAGSVALILLLAVVTTRATTAGGRKASPLPDRPGPAMAMTTATSACPTPSGAFQGDLDGDGCDETLSSADGVVGNGTTRVRVGDGTDRVATGRWTCGSSSYLALIRPGGDVYVFTEWAKPGQPATARIAGHVDGGADIAAADSNGDGCDEIVVTTTTGATATIDPRQPS